MIHQYTQLVGQFNLNAQNQILCGKTHDVVTNREIMNLFHVAYNLPAGGIGAIALLEGSESSQAHMSQPHTTVLNPIKDRDSSA